MKKHVHLFFVLAFISSQICAQKFYFGADLSYVNEMEQCGAAFKENGQVKDVYDIFAAHHSNLARFRIWHTPSFYDTLNNGLRYSDFNDVRRGILRAKSAGMDILLDFHLSDFWADPSRQIVPKAWEPVANNLPLLKDSLYNYVYQTLIQLNQDNLLPELVQIGNETNKGIMQTPAQNAGGWSLDWVRNAELFKRAIQAVRDVETITGKKMRIAIHIADPAETGWLMQAFWANGVRDFDIIGISYYWAWHKPVTIAQTGTIISQLRNDYPSKSVMIFETGYLWTTASNDQAANIISETDPAYGQASPESQKKWLIDLTQEVINQGGEGVMYWEPAWVSTPCWTPWGQGSHQEHATFFNFNNETMLNGGMTWPEYPFANLSSAQNTVSQLATMVIAPLPNEGQIRLHLKDFGTSKSAKILIFDNHGRTVHSTAIALDSGKGDMLFALPHISSGLYFVLACDGSKVRVIQKMIWP